jgi:hypothetical protein
MSTFLASLKLPKLAVLGPHSCLSGQVFPARWQSLPNFLHSCQLLLQQGSLASWHELPYICYFLLKVEKYFYGEEKSFVWK